MPSRMLSTLVLVGVLATAGCGDQAEAPEAAADRFEEAVAQGDGAAACALLAEATVDELEQSEGRPCAKAVLDEAEPAGARTSGSRYGTMAQVRYRSDVLFLTSGPEGWRVLAAGCKPSRGAPYDCKVSGS